MDIFDQITQEAKKAGDFIAGKAELIKSYAVATWSAAEIRNKIDQLYKEIGKAVYAVHTEGKETAEEIETKVEEITALKQALIEKEEAKQSLRNRTLCPACGKAVPKGSSFCNYCGAEIH